MSITPPLLAALAVMLACGTILADEPIAIRGNRLGNWWQLGDEVVFTTQNALPPGTRRVHVAVTDAMGTEVHRDSVSAEVFLQRGWHWLANAPGFYLARFTLQGDDLSQLADEPFSITIRKQDREDRRKYYLLARQTFPFTDHAIAIAPGPTPAPPDISPHFGASPHFSFYRDALALSRLVGFHSLRIHSISWEAVEKEPGVYDWSDVDDFMNLAREMGYPDEQIVFNIFKTPRWASTRPEADWVNICIREYASVAPKDLTAWQNFLRETIRRYPRVLRYELWNEPHLRGFSCFWADSTENFVALLKAGYEAVKAEKPDATVWLGGIGMRYLPFYEEFLRLGGGQYYDVLPLHGSWPYPEPFHRLEKQFGLSPKPVVSSEWHAMLLKPNFPNYPSDVILARTMLLDFLNQIRAGVQEVDLFCILNIGNSEKESLALYREHGSFQTHVSGLFRRLPYIQARYPALAWHVFTRHIKGTLTVDDGYAFGSDGQQQAIAISHDAGRQLIFWNNAELPAPVCAELRQATNGHSVMSADGRKLSVTPGMLLPPDTYFYLDNPAPALLATWQKQRRDVLQRQQATTPLSLKAIGSYRNAPLFADDLSVIDPDTIPWQTITRSVSLTDKAHAMQARFAVALTAQTLDLIVETNDDTPTTLGKELDALAADSLLFALDTRQSGIASDCLEFAAASTGNGQCLIWKRQAPALAGDLPEQYTHANEPLRFAQGKILHADGKTNYHLRLAASELMPFTFAEHPAPRFALAINDHDGTQRTSYHEWASGIATTRAPQFFGTLFVALPNQPLLVHADLKNKGWNQNDYDVTFPADTSETVTRITSRSPLCSGLASETFPVQNGAAYRIRFAARGNAKIQAIIAGDGITRTDIVKRTTLTDDWQAFDLPFFPPPGASTARVSIFAWNQPDCSYDIRDFVVQPLAMPNDH